MRINVISFGYGHAAAPNADLIVDTRRLLHDPHIDPAMRQRTGHDDVVRDRVLATPGARAWIYHTAATVHALASACGREVTVAVGCVGGRHRSVVIAEEVTGVLRRSGCPVRLEHRDVAKPVIGRSVTALP
jgi:UPF0042 nucleotide-binding protein